jgi:DNA repair exonuclease SbcCD ATPase subunit
MTALGKTLTVFVFLLSLVWCWLTVNAYATRTNWVTQAKTAQTHTQAAIERAREMEQAYRELVTSAEAQAKKLADTIVERDSTIAKLQTDNAAIKAQFDRKLAAEKVDENKTALLEKNEKATLEQLNVLKANKDAIENKLIEATRNEQAARNESLQQKLEAESLRARNETIELQLAQLQEQMRDLRSRRQRPGRRAGRPGSFGHQGHREEHLFRRLYHDLARG